MVWNLKNKTKLNITKKNRLTDKENKLVVTSEEREGERGTRRGREGSLQPHRLAHRFLCPWGFSRQEYWSGRPCPPPGDLPNPRIEPRSPTLHADSLPSKSPRKPKTYEVLSIKKATRIHCTTQGI